MKKKLVYLFVIVVALIMQTSILPVFVRSAAVPDALLMLVLAWSVIDGFNNALPWVIVAGVLYDLVDYAAVGTHVLMFILTVYFVSFFSKRFTVEVQGIGVMMYILFVLVATIILRGVTVFINVLQTNASRDLAGQMFATGGIFFEMIIGNLILFIVWVMIVKKLKNYFSLA